MSRAGGFLLVFSLVAVPAATAQALANSVQDLGRAMTDAGVGKTGSNCKSSDPARRSARSAEADAVIVCGRRSERFRIDRHVLETERAAAAQPPRPSLMDEALIAQRYGDHPEHGRVIPNKLIGVPMGKGAGGPELAAKGNSLPEALRQGKDEYGDYRDASEQQPGRK